MLFKEKCFYIEKCLTQYLIDLSYIKYYKDKSYYGEVSFSRKYGCNPQGYESYLNRQIYHYQEALKRINCIESCQKQIGEEYYHIIYMDFIKKEKDWYYDYYSKATYYRKKNKALDAFIIYIKKYYESFCELFL